VSSRKLSEPEALNFALMLLAGASASVASSYFLPPGYGQVDVEEAVDTWPRQPEVLKALQTLTGGVPWHEMSDEERINLALKKHRNEMAFMLWTMNYAEVSGVDKAKLDTCRESLEAVIAGTAGKGNEMEQFYQEILRQHKLSTLAKVGQA
jgi:hypothetical protein